MHVTLSKGEKQVTKQHVQCDDTFVSKSIYVCIKQKAWKATENTGSGYLSAGRDGMISFLFFYA